MTVWGPVSQCAKIQAQLVYDDEQQPKAQAALTRASKQQAADEALLTQLRSAGASDQAEVDRLQGEVQQAVERLGELAAQVGTFSWRGSRCLCNMLCHGVLSFLFHNPFSKKNDSVIRDLLSRQGSSTRVLFSYILSPNINVWEGIALCTVSGLSPGMPGSLVKALANSPGVDLSQRGAHAMRW